MNDTELEETPLIGRRNTNTSTDNSNTLIDVNNINGTSSDPIINNNETLASPSYNDEIMILPVHLNGEEENGRNKTNTGIIHSIKGRLKSTTATIRSKNSSHSHSHSHSPDSHNHSHGHSHGHGHHHHDLKGKSKSVLMIVFGLTVGFLVIELIAGYAANSLALLADAYYKMSDAFALTLSLIAILISQRPASHKFTFGYDRAEVFGALMSGFLLWAVCVHLVHESLERLESVEEEEVNGVTVVWIATGSLIVNLINIWLLAPAQESINVKAAYLHALSDCLGSFAVIISGFMTTYLTPVADPFITILFACFIFWNSLRIVRESAEILMEANPLSNEEMTSLEEAIKDLPGVISIKDLHVWTISSQKVALSLTVSSTETKNTTAKVQDIARRIPGLEYTTIQIDAPDMGYTASSVGGSSITTGGDRRGQKRKKAGFGKSQVKNI